MQSLIRFLCEEEAATAVEYAVMLAMVLVAAFGAVSAFGFQTGELWGGIQDDLMELESFGPGPPESAPTS